MSSIPIGEFAIKNIAAFQSMFRLSPNKYKWRDVQVRSFIDEVRGGSNEVRGWPARVDLATGSLELKEGSKWKRVVPEENVEYLLERYIKDPLTQGSPKQLFAKLKDKYIGVSRSRVTKWANNEQAIQLQKPAPLVRPTRTILAIEPNERWQMDMVDLTPLGPQNGGSRWLLTVVDTYSRKAWVVPTRRKEGLMVRDALEGLFAETGSPAILQSDNGTEFLNEDVQDLLAEHGVIHVTSSIYNPKSQGQVERFNGTIKKKIKRYMLLHNTKRYVDDLPDLVDNYNDTKHSTTRVTPNELYARGKDDVVIRRVARKANQRNKKHKPRVFKRGDSVRIRTKSIPENRRRGVLHKPMNNWTEEVYEVLEVHSGSKSKRGTRGIGDLKDRRRGVKDKTWDLYRTTQSKHVYSGFELLPVDLSALRITADHDIVDQPDAPVDRRMIPQAEVDELLEEAKEFQRRARQVRERKKKKKKEPKKPEKPKKPKPTGIMGMTKGDWVLVKSLSVDEYWIGKYQKDLSPTEFEILWYQIGSTGRVKWYGTKDKVDAAAILVVNFTLTKNQKIPARVLALI